VADPEPVRTGSVDTLGAAARGTDPTISPPGEPFLLLLLESRQPAWITGAEGPGHVDRDHDRDRDRDDQAGAGSGVADPESRRVATNDLMFLRCRYTTSPDIPAANPTPAQPRQMTNDVGSRATDPTTEPMPT
jgi:hypothetical protein